MKCVVFQEKIKCVLTTDIFRTYQEINACEKEFCAKVIFDIIIVPAQIS